MPIGIPKIPYLVPGDDDASWTDLYNRIYHQRLLFLGQEINSEMSNHLTGLMVFLSMEDKDRDIFLFINSPGGGIISGMAVFDIMNAVEADVQTIGAGLVASMASVLLLGGEITKRLAFPHARVMMHQPASSFYDGISGESVMELKEFEKMRDSIVKIYVQRTGKPPWQISRDIERDFFMTAEEAKDYGIIDIVAEGHYF